MIERTCCAVSKGIGILIERVCCAVGKGIRILIEGVVLWVNGLGFLLGVYMYMYVL